MKFNNSKRVLASAVAIMAFGLIGLSQSAVAGPSENSDCVGSVSALELYHGCWIIEKGPGPCPEWRQGKLVFSETLKFRGDGRYQAVDPKWAAQVEFRNGWARFKIKTNTGVVENSVEVVPHNNLPGVFSASFAHREVDWAHGEGRHYDLSCHFGFSDEINKIKDAEEKEMDRLGPARDWPDRQAPSMSEIRPGAVIEFTRDLEILPGSDKAKVLFVEEVGLQTLKEFNALRLPFRYAYAEIHNANNGYLERTEYPKGLRMKVVKVESQRLNDAAVRYDLLLETLSPSAVLDPVKRIEIYGRRGGRSDLKIDQAVELLRLGGLELLNGRQ